MDRQTIDKLRILKAMLRGTFEKWHKEVWTHDLDARFCCDGRECGCQGSTLGDVYMWQVKP
jgi:hypothetical protein